MRSVKDHDSTRASLYPVTLDVVHYNHKPQGQAGRQTLRLQQSGHVLVSLDELCNEISRGACFCCGCFTPRTWPFVEHGWNWGRFLGQRLFACDFDDHAGVAAPNPLDMLDRGIARGLNPVFWYLTFSGSEDNPRHRVVFDAGEVLDDEDSRFYDMLLKDTFPECDAACHHRRHNAILQGTDKPCQLLVPGYVYVDGVGYAPATHVAGEVAA